ncbi:MAG: T9SS type A sorting domain-containing protein [candidate division Zixibacteria bacterium]|nr:T9SS type A sorting domain-containing protein [candidate division Zixibacteria bacterium]
MDDVMAAYPDEVAGIRVHVWWPSSSDPFYQFNTADNRGRTQWYGVSGVPAGFVDGSSCSYSSFMSRVQSQLNDDSPLDINIYGDFNSNTRQVSLVINVVVTGTVDSDNLKLHIAVTEDGLSYGGHDENQILRDMVPDHQGQSIMLVDNSEGFYTRDFNLMSGINENNAYLNIIVQDADNKEILQANKVMVTDLTPYPGTLGEIYGNVHDSRTGAPLDAELFIVNRTPTIFAVTNGSGDYSMTVPDDAYWGIKCEVPNSNYLPDSALVYVPTGGSVELDFEMSLPPVMVGMIPYNPPVMVPPGGFFRFIGTLTNQTDENQVTDLWVMLQLPDQSYYGPITYFPNIPLAPNQQITQFSVRQDIPYFAPPGTYEYIALVGDYPYSFYHFTSFEFTVTSQLMGEADEWKLSNWIGAEGELPSEVSLFNNYPNPFNAQTTIKFDIPESGNVSLKVYNISGQEVETLVDGKMDAGQHSISWDASNYASGVYFYKLQTGDNVITKKMNLLK